jgi:hypothetical protein
MGLGPKRLYILMIDPDEANYNVNRTQTLITRYLTLKKRLGLPSDSSDFPLFKTEITFSKDKNGQPIYLWTPVGEKKTLKTYFEFPRLPKEYKDLAKLLYTEGELELEWDQGFRGRASVGAPVMAGIAQKTADEPWYSLIQDIKGTLSKDFAKLFIFATIFGATGASGFPTVAKILRDISEEWDNKEKFKIGGALLLPYFSYRIPPEKEKEIYVRPEHFLLNAKTALSHYHFLWQLIPSPYDAIYLIGDRTMDYQGREFGEGGTKQKNSVHYIELLSALAALHFYQSESKAEREHYQYYAGREVPNEESNIVNWQDIPFPKELELEHQMLFFSSLAIAYLSFYSPLIRNPKFEEKWELTPWAADSFKKGSLSLRLAREDQEELAYYFCSYLKWLCEIHLSTDRDLKLLNKEALKIVLTSLTGTDDITEALTKDEFKEEINVEDNTFKNLLHPEARTYTPIKYGYDELWERMCQIKEKPTTKKEVGGAGITETESEIGKFVTGKLLLFLYTAIRRFCNKNYDLKIEEG